MANITIIGGGNMGSVLAAKFSQKHDVTLFLNAPYEVPSEYSKNLLLFNEEHKTYVKANIRNITDNLSEAIKDAEWIFITYPSFMFESFSKTLIPLLHSNQHLVGIPGSGGFELFFKNAVEKGCAITGLQRVHSVARIIKKGEEVRESGVRQSLKCASIPSSFNDEASKFLSDCYSLPVEQLDNYLNITLINSNPILHTSRLYSIFKDLKTVKKYESLPLFYEEWSLETSELLEKMDEELFKMINKLKENEIPVNNITSLLVHYESNNPTELTNKLRSINSLKGLQTPSVKLEDRSFIPDLNSRYFTADFPFGLDILLSFSEILKEDCPNMRMVSDWYHDISNTKKTFSLSNFGIHDAEDLKTFYVK